MFDIDAKNIFHASFNITSKSFRCDSKLEMLNHSFPFPLIKHWDVTEFL